MVKVENMQSVNGNDIPNQFIITDGNVIYFQSYNTVIAKKEGGNITLDKDGWDYSRTTGKYRNLFLGETKKETERKIKDGIYHIGNLNI